MMEHDLPPASALDESAPLGDDLPAPLPLVTGYQRLEDAILDECFPEVDLALRRGRHVHKGDERWYRFLSEARELLQPFYRRFGCELEERGDGYFFLLPVSDGLGKRHLGVPEMIVGQGLALCYLDPQSVQSGGVISREELLNQLAAVMGTDALMHTLNPKRKRVDERVMQRTVRQKVNEALRRLSLLGFVELLEGDQLRLAPSLMRFAEPVRGLDAPSEALKRLIERGEVSLGPGDAEHREADDDESEADASVDELDQDEHEGPIAVERSDVSERSDGGAVADSSAHVGAGLSPDDVTPADESVAAEGDDADGPPADAAGVGWDDIASALPDPDAGGIVHAHDPDAHDDHHSDDHPEEEAAPGSMRGAPARYEAFPANDAGHTDAALDVHLEAAQPATPVARRGADGPASDDDDDYGDAAPRSAYREHETDARAAGTEVPEHVEIDFDWDTLPDEEA